MLGNDLIYLPGWSTPGGTRAERFRAKIFTARERQWLEAHPPLTGEALLWSMKEAAYKAYLRQSGQKPFYAPRRLECQVDTWDGQRARGRVSCGAQHYHTRSTREGDYLHSLALAASRTGDWPQIQCGSSAYARSQDLRIPVAGRSIPLRIRKDSRGLPQLYDQEDQALPHLLSLSHDGARVAWAWV